MTAWLDAARARFSKQSLQSIPRLVWAGAAAALVAIAVVGWLWASGPNYAVLYSQLDDKDGGEVVAALEKLNVPYKFDHDGGAIMVPADVMRRTRLKLAAEGLPKNGNVGFDLLEKNQFGASEFTQRVTYQRALEGELARTIEAIDVISSATVHLAIPAPTLFVRERKLPSASILVNLRPGRTLSDGQIAAIAWLVSSGVPDLSPDHVSVVDQYGHLLSTGGSIDGMQANASHLSYQRRLEQQVIERIQSILTPVLGAGNVRAQVSAELDFSKVEDTAETYQPNTKPEDAAVRSKQTHDTTQVGVLPAQGVPGALSNTPPATAAARVVAPTGGATAGAKQEKADQGPRDDTHSATINYELDRRITHTQAPVGRLERLSVAVIVNDQPGPKGALQPISAKQMAQITELVKQAMGYSAKRGDTVNVVNTKFRAEPVLAWWRDPYWWGLARTIGLDLLALLVLWLAWSRGIKPFAKAWIEANAPAPDLVRPNLVPAAPEPEQAATSQFMLPKDRYEDNLTAVRDVAEKDPRAMAMVMRAWVERKKKDEERD